MPPILASFRSGAWLTQARMRAYSMLLLLIAALAIIGWLSLSDEMIDYNGKPVGTDFSNPYAAGTLALAGRAIDAYDPERQHAAEKTVFDGRYVPFYGWHYPPFFFGVAALVALLPYAAGLLLWLGASFAAYLAAIRAILPLRQTALLATAFPAVFVNIGHGQNGFFTAALLGGALYLLQSKPWVAGVLIGLLAYKPQFGVLIPLALLAGGHGRAIAAATATVAALALLSTLALGPEIWRAFADSTSFTQSVVLEQGGTGWEKIQSIFSAMRMWGANVPSAYTAQAALALPLAAAISRIWRRDVAFDLQASALATASLLATPYVLDYDLMVLAVSIAFFVRHGLTRGFRSYEISVLAFAWIAPLLTRGIADETGIPLGLIAMLAMFAITLRRIMADRAAVTSHAPMLAQA